MSEPTYVVMLADGAQNPITIPGTRRTYTTTTGTAIIVPGEDAAVLLAHGWTGAYGGKIVGGGLQANMPASNESQVGDMWVKTDGTANLLIFAGPIRQWLTAYNGTYAATT